jgi:hypothetical protein
MHYCMSSKPLHPGPKQRTRLLFLQQEARGLIVELPVPSRIAALVEVGATLAAVTDRQGALACWVEAERLIVNSSCWEGDAELPSLAALLARYGEYAWLLRLVQWCWL